VKILSGESKGTIGIIKNITGDIATLHIEGSLELDIPTSSIVKYFNLHDYVKVREGVNIGRHGWVTLCTPPLITIFDSEKSCEVWRSLHARYTPDCHSAAHCHVL
jgi:transcription elongation factor